MSLAGEIARFYGQGKEAKNGAGWLTMCAYHDNHNTPALSVTDDGNDDVKVFCHSGCDFKQIKDLFRRDGLLPKWEPEKKAGKKYNRPATKPADISNQADPESSELLEKEINNAPAKEEKESFAWKQAGKDGLEHAKKYLAGRAITMELPVCLKWGSYKEKDTGEINNMIVAAASKPDDEKVYAVQRLFIDLETHKKVDGRMLGECEGRGVWFNRKGDKKEIVIGEGIETVLSVIQATGKNGVAALSTAGIKNLIIPAETDTIYICADSDPAKLKEAVSMPGQKAAYVAAANFEASREGRTAYLVSPDDTCFSDHPEKLDFNDLLKADPSGETIRARFEKAVRFADLQWAPPVVVNADKPKNDLSARQSMFDRFVFLASENKIIDTVGHDIKDSMMIERAFTLSQAGSLYYYTDQDGSEKFIPLTKHWLMSEDKKIASSLKYKPGSPLFFENGDGRSYYNTFRFPYQQVAEMSAKDQQKRLICWNKIMDAVFHEHRSYIEDWFSFSIQHPEKRTGIMPICISDVGLGKSLIMAIMSRVVGHQNFSNAKILDVTGLGRTGTQWGDWIFNKKISCIEEIDPEGETGISYKILDALKDIITNETLSLNLKGGRNGTFQVFANIIGFSNHKNCVKIPFGDRRLFVVDSTSQKLLAHHEYKELWDWILDERNIIAVYQYLFTRKINDEFVPGQAKMTNAKKGLQVDGRSTLQTAFDLMIEQYPSDLMTNGEIQLAVSQAIAHISGDDIDYQTNWNSEKQFQAILKTTTTLIGGGKRVKTRRKGGERRLQPSLIRAIRNGQDWIGATNNEIRVAMDIEIPWKWIVEDEDNIIPF
jgi:hypothetical protein